MQKVKDRRLGYVGLEPIKTTLRSRQKPRAAGLKQEAVSRFGRWKGAEIGGPNPAAEVQCVGQLRDGFYTLFVDSEEAERKRIARELHDGLGQLLTSINLHALQCLNTAGSEEKSSAKLQDSLQTISAMAKQAISEMRGICGALRPAILDDLGVAAAINWQCRQLAKGDGNLKVTTDIAVHETAIPESHKTTVYRIVQEALNNAAKYARARNLWVRLHQIDGYLRLHIRDDGRGFDPRQVDGAGGMGLTSMRERSESVGGLFELLSSEGAGVEIRVLLPLEKVALSG